MSECEDRLRDLTRRLGFGDNITDPMADNDTIVKWYEERSSEASEWVEAQSWREDCYVAGHPDTEDCWEHDPSLRLEAAEAKVARCEALAANWLRLSATAMDVEVREWTAAAGRSVRAALASPSKARGGPVHSSQCAALGHDDEDSCSRGLYANPPSATGAAAVGGGEA